MKQQLIQTLEQQSTLSNSMTVAGLLNGMIGGTILILPIIGISTGYLTAVIVSCVLGFITYYTANLIIVHLGKSKNMTECILNHFGQNYSYMTAYALIVFCGQIPTLFIYFNLICLQIQGLIGYRQHIAFLVAVLLVLIAITTVYFNIGQQAMGLGIISIVSYVIFVAWTMITASAYPQEIPAFGNPFLLISTLLMAYTIHDLLSQNILKNPNKQDYRSIVGVTFVFGTLIYTFITLGSFGIVNRKSIKSKPQTIQDYFQMGGIQVTIIELIYLVHLVSVFPQFLRLSKIRFFNAFKIQIHRSLQWRQILYFIVIILVCFTIHQFGVQIGTMISINGSIIGTLLVVFIPILVHIKCIYLDKKCGNIEGELIETSDRECACNYTYSHKSTKNIELIFLIIVVIVGFVTMIGSIKQIFAKK